MTKSRGGNRPALPLLFCCIWATFMLYAPLSIARSSSVSSLNHRRHERTSRLISSTSTSAHDDALAVSEPSSIASLPSEHNLDLAAVHGARRMASHAVVPSTWHAAGSLVTIPLGPDTAAPVSVPERTSTSMVTLSQKQRWQSDLMVSRHPIVGSAAPAVIASTSSQGMSELALTIGGGAPQSQARGRSLMGINDWCDGKMGPRVMKGGWT